MAKKASAEKRLAQAIRDLGFEKAESIFQALQVLNAPIRDHKDRSPNKTASPSGRGFAEPRESDG